MNDQAAASALYALEPDQEVALRAHLPGCASCREVARDAEIVARGLAACVEQIDPPARLRGRILASAAPRPGPAGSRHDVLVTPHLPGRGNDGARSWRRVTSRRRVAVAAAMVVAFTALAGYSTDLYRQRAAEHATVQALTAFVARLSTPGAHVATLRAADGRPVAVVLATAAEQTVLTTALPANDPARSTYVMWGVGNSAPRPIGTFDTTTDSVEPGLHALMPPDGRPFLGYAVSLEPGRRAPDAPTHVVASGQLTT